MAFLSLSLSLSLSLNIRPLSLNSCTQILSMASLPPLSISYGPRLSPTPKRNPFFNARRLQFIGVLRKDRFLIRSSSRQILDEERETERLALKSREEKLMSVVLNDGQNNKNILLHLRALFCAVTPWFSSSQVAESSERLRTDMVYEIGELFELGIQLSYLLILLGLLGVGTFFVIRQVLVRRELDLSAKELQEQVRSGDATATEYFELGAVMLRRKFYPAAIKYLRQAIEKWDRDDQDLAQVYNGLGVSYVRDNQLDKGITQFETAVKLQPGYVTAWNNLGDAYEKRKDLRAALKAFEEVLLFDPNNKVARPRRDALRARVQLYKGVPLKSEDR